MTVVEEPDRANIMFEYSCVKSELLGELIE